MTAPQAAKAGVANPSAGGRAASGQPQGRPAGAGDQAGQRPRRGSWLPWLLILLLLGGLGAGGWFYWPRLRPALQNLPLVGRLIPSPVPAATPVPAESGASPAPTGTSPAGSNGQPASGQTDSSGGQAAPPAAPTQADLEARAAQLDQLAKTLAADRQALDQQKAAAAGVERVAAVYKEMKPADAAGILTKLSDNDLVPILLALPNDQVAQILAAMDATRAAQLTKTIASARATP